MVPRVWPRWASWCRTTIGGSWCATPAGGWLTQSRGRPFGAKLGHYQPGEQGLNWSSYTLLKRRQTVCHLNVLLLRSGSGGVGNLLKTGTIDCENFRLLEKLFVLC